MLFPRPLYHAACTAALALITSVGASAQYAHLTLQSQPGDFIGQGQNYDITYNPAGIGGGRIFASILPSSTGGLPDFARFSFYQFTQNPFSVINSGSLDFSSQGLGVPLTPGTYTDAQRAAGAAAGHPGLDVSFDGRGSNTLTGNFTVTDFTYSTVTSPFSTTYTIDTFAATFEQHSEGRTPALFGTFTYSANGPAAVPEASTTFSFGLLLALGGGGAVVAARKKKAAA